MYNRRRGIPLQRPRPASRLCRRNSWRPPGTPDARTARAAQPRSILSSNRRPRLLPRSRPPGRRRYSSAFDARESLQATCSAGLRIPVAAPLTTQRTALYENGRPYRPSSVLKRCMLKGTRQCVIPFTSISHRTFCLCPCGHPAGHFVFIAVLYRLIVLARISSWTCAAGQRKTRCIPPHAP